MGNVSHYRKTVFDVLSSHMKADYAVGDITKEMVVDEKNDRYLVMVVGWEGPRRVHGALLHVDIIDGCNAGSSTSGTSIKNWAFFSNEFRSFGGSGAVAGLYIAAEPLIVVDNIFDPAGGGTAAHTIRVQHCWECFIHGNLFDTGGASSNHAITFRGLDPGHSSGFGTIWTEKMVISDNYFSTDHDSPLQIYGSGGSGLVCDGRHTIVERNFFKHGTTSGSQHIWVDDCLTSGGSGNETETVTIRNNICDLTAATDQECISVSTKPAGLAHLYGNLVLADTNSGSDLLLKTSSLDVCVNNVVWNKDAGDAASSFVSNCTTHEKNYDNDGGAEATSLTTCPIVSCTPTDETDYQINATDTDGLKTGGSTTNALWSFCDFGQNDRDATYAAGPWEPDGAGSECTATAAGGGGGGGTPSGALIIVDAEEATP